MKSKTQSLGRIKEEFPPRGNLQLFQLETPATFFCAFRRVQVTSAKVDVARAAVAEAIIKHAAKLKLSNPYEFRVSAVIPQESRISESLHILRAGTSWFQFNAAGQSPSND